MFECEKRGDRKVEFCGEVEGGRWKGGRWEGGRGVLWGGKTLIAKSLWLTAHYPLSCTSLLATGEAAWFDQNSSKVVN